MAQVSSYTIKKDRNSMAGLSAYDNGGPTSGNFGHRGRPGQRGGSGKGIPTSYSPDSYLSKEEYENVVNHTSLDNFSEDELDAIGNYVQSMDFGQSADLNKAIR